MYIQSSKNTNKRSQHMNGLDEEIMHFIPDQALRSDYTKFLIWVYIKPE